MRTHVLVDAELVRRAKKLTGLKTNRAVAEEGLRLLVELQTGLTERSSGRLKPMRLAPQGKPDSSARKPVIEDRGPGVRDFDRRELDAFLMKDKINPKTAAKVRRLLSDG